MERMQSFGTIWRISLSVRQAEGSLGRGRFEIPTVKAKAYNQFRSPFGAQLIRWDGFTRRLRRHSRFGQAQERRRRRRSFLLKACVHLA